MAGRSIVENFRDRDGYRCGYCGSTDSNYSHGMWAHQMTCEDYQDLIDRGWRRSGKYCYKPAMSKMCCPCYPIRCEALNFKPTKSQKKVLRRMSRYLTTAKSDEKEAKSEVQGSSDSTFHEGAAPPSDFNDALHDRCQSAVTTITCDSIDTAHLIKAKPQASGSPSSSTPNKPLPSADVDKGQTKATCVGPDPSKPPCRKAKVIRRERWQKKMAAKGMERERRSRMLSKQTGAGPQALKSNAAKSIEDWLVERLPNTPLIHKLEVKLVRVDPNLPEFSSTFSTSAQVFFKYQKAVHKDPPEKCTEKRVKLIAVDLERDEFRSTHTLSGQLFAKYQMAIHKDKPEECTESQYKRFLVDSPLMHSRGPGAPSTGYGSFHQQYWLDGKLIAVGVLDILPHCVSSVYLFYDPEYSFLSLGVYSALREVQLTRQLNSESPDLKYYYMGFYIHSCPKMKYKGNYYPSFLVCPETYRWVPIENCRPKLDASKYSRLHDSSDSLPPTDINTMLILYRRKAMPYQIYRIIKGSAQGEDDDEEEDDDDDDGDADDSDEVQELADMIGPQVARRMLLFRS